MSCMHECPKCGQSLEVGSTGSALFVFIFVVAVVLIIAIDTLGERIEELKKAQSHLAHVVLKDQR